MRLPFEQEDLMRIASLVFAGALAASAGLAGPTLARNADSPKNDDKTAASSCSAYQQAPDGSWEQLPCKEAGDRGQPQTQNRSGSRGTQQSER
jgi:hypothetical protein